MIATGATELSLYRSGWSDGEAPWPDNQLWARVPYWQVPPVAGEHHATLYPEYGSAASYYQVRLLLDESPEVDWVTARVNLNIDGRQMSPVPLPISWYVGAAHDWPSGLARFREPDGFRTPHFPIPEYGARGVWTLAARRAQ